MPKSLISIPNMGRKRSNHFRRITILNFPTFLEVSDQFSTLRATSHSRMRAYESYDHYTSITLIDGNGGASPSLLYTTLEGPTKYVNARWM